MSTITLTIDLGTTSADAVSEVLRILSGSNGTTSPVKTLNGKKAAKAETTAEVSPAPESSAAPITETLQKTNMTIEAVRALVAAKAKAGKREAIKELLTEYGVENVTSLPSAKYESFYNQVNSL